MTTVGPNNPSAAASVEDGGNTDWSGPGDVGASDDQYARCVDLPDGRSSKLLIATDFGFAIPAGATIDGVTVVIERKTDAAETIVDEVVSLTLDGASLSGENKANVVEHWVAGEDRSASYGSNSDNWQLGLSPEAVNNEAFGVALKVQNNGGAGPDTARVDNIRVAIDYTAGASASRNSGINRLLAGVG